MENSTSCFEAVQLFIRDFVSGVTMQVREFVNTRQVASKLLGHGPAKGYVAHHAGLDGVYDM